VHASNPEAIYSARSGNTKVL